MSQYFFYFYLFSILVLGSFNVGPYSIRVYMTVIMLVYLIINRTRSKINPFPLQKRFVAFYALFVVFTALSLFLNGEYAKFDFNKVFLANYLNCFVTFFAFDFFVTDGRKLRNVIIVLVGIILFNDVVTYLQFIGNPIGKAVAMAFTTMTEVKEEIGDDAGYDVISLFGEGLPIGIFGFVFTNANYIACFGTLIVSLLFGTKSKLFKYGLLASLALTVYACYATQERMAFFMFIITLIFLFIYGPNKKNEKILFVLLVVIGIIYILPSLIQSDSLGRLVSTDYKEDVRGQIWKQAFDFVMDHPLLGGPVAYSKTISIAPHNFFLNAFINSGLIGGLIASLLFLYMTLQAIRYILKRHYGVLMATAGAVLIYNAICVFHNASIVSGDTLIFVLYPIMLKAAVIERPSINFTSNYRNDYYYPQPQS